jgi:4-hydroxy-2-oxoglutarate aldolase
VNATTSSAGDHSWFAGVFLPVTTPFDPVTGEIAPISMRENLRRWTQEPIDGIVLFGSTGEGALLDEEEKLKLMGFARDVLPGGMPLIAGTGADSTRSSIRQSKSLAEVGADAVLVHAPSYFGGSLSSGDLRDHYLRVADASPVPVILYNIPKYTKIAIEPGLVAELIRHPNIIGLKDSSGDIKKFAEFTNVCGKDCRLFIGSGSNFFTALELGASGGILGLAVLDPRGCATVFENFRSGNKGEAGKVQEQIAPVHNEIVKQFGARGVKVALDLLGYTGGPPRSPLSPLPEKDRALVTRVMQEAGLLEGVSA